MPATSNRALRQDPEAWNRGQASEPGWKRLFGIPCFRRIELQPALGLHLNSAFAHKPAFGSRFGSQEPILRTRYTPIVLQLLLKSPSQDARQPAFNHL